MSQTFYIFYKTLLDLKEMFYSNKYFEFKFSTQKRLEMFQKTPPPEKTKKGASGMGGPLNYNGRPL